MTRKTLALVAGLSLAAAAPSHANLVITPAAGFSATWDGNDGTHFDQTAPPAGSIVPDNLALAGTPFTSSDLGPELSIGFHVAANLNDGFYGNANSWIGASGTPAPFFAGVDLGGSFELASVAWGRDNGNGAPDDTFAGTDCCGGQLDDRTLGIYTLQITNDGAVGPGSNWTDVASFNFVSNDDVVLGGEFTSYFRHEFNIATSAGGSVTATGVRLLVPATGLGSGTAIDEIEVYAVPEPGTYALLAGLAGLAVVALRRRR